MPALVDAAAGSYYPRDEGRESRREMGVFSPLSHHQHSLLPPRQSKKGDLPKNASVARPVVVLFGVRFCATLGAVFLVVVVVPYLTDREWGVCTYTRSTALFGLGERGERRERREEREEREERWALLREHFIPWRGRRCC